MEEKAARPANAGGNLISALKSWVMVVLTLIFTLLYGAALVGWLKPLTDDKMASRLEPIIFVIIGYYFGRLPAQQNEQMLKGELNRQAQKNDATQFAKEQAQHAREALEEKIKNVRITLASSATGAAAKEFVRKANEAAAPSQVEVQQQKMLIALGILNS